MKLSRIILAAAFLGIVLALSACGGGNNKTLNLFNYGDYLDDKLVEAFENMAYASREVARASKIYNMMLNDKNCSVILCIAGSLISAGMKKIIVDMIQNHMVDAIVSNGANIVDQDFFEALGFKHYIGTPYNQDDNLLRDLHIDRIYDTYIDEDQLKDLGIAVTDWE